MRVCTACLPSPRAVIVLGDSLQRRAVASELAFEHDVRHRLSDTHRFAWLPVGDEPDRRTELARLEAPRSMIPMLGKGGAGGIRAPAPAGTTRGATPCRWGHPRTPMNQPPTVLEVARLAIEYRNRGI
jgi:hypothetical protein